MPEAHEQSRLDRPRGMNKRNHSMVIIMRKMDANHLLTLLAVITVAAMLAVPGPAVAADPAAVASPRSQQGGAPIPEVTEILGRISVYDYGDSREPLSDLRELVRANLDSQPARRQIEQAMIEVLGSDATFAGKQFVAEQISIVGTAASVPVLVSMLSLEPGSDIALFALQRIPGQDVDAALIGSLTSADPTSRIAIINTLGERRSASAVAELASLLEGAGVSGSSSNDDRIASVAAVALGKIAGASALAALDTARGNTSGRVRRAVLDAYLACADELLAEGNSAGATGIYREVYEEEDSVQVRAAALRGLVLAEAENAVASLLEALRRDNQRIQSMAAGLARGLPDTADLTSISDELVNFSDTTQIQLISAFAYREETGAHRAVLSAVGHHDPDVRSAALAALARIGDESDIDLLVKIAVSGEPVSNRETAHASLIRMSAAGIDESLIAAIPAAEPEARAEIVRSLGERNSTGAIGVLLSTAADPDERVRGESFKSLAIVAGPDRIDDLIRLLVGEQADDTRNEAERTVVLVSEKIEGAEQAGPVLAALPTVSNVETRSSLIEVLGRIGDVSALPILKTELSGDAPEYRRAAILALSSWPDAVPSDDLLQVARASDSQVERVLALRGFIELTRMESDRPDGESIERLQTAMSLATETSEKRMVLAGLGEVHSVEALAVTVPYLDDPVLRPEAEAALLRQIGAIRQETDERLPMMLDAGLRERLQRILEASENERLRTLTSELLERGQ